MSLDPQGTLEIFAEEAVAITRRRAGENRAGT